jgi:hypothetical protein
MAATSLTKNSVTPVSATVLTYSSVYITWADPNPVDYIAIRLVRNQYAFSETQEDGNILYEYNNAAGLSTTVFTSYTDGVSSSLSDVILVSGQYAYYTIWMLVTIATNTDVWVNAGSASVLIPKQHGTTVNKSTTIKTTHTKIMELLPRAMTSTSNNPLDEINTNSDIYNFLKAFSLTYDEILTYADLTVKYLPAKYISDNLVIPSFKRLGLRITSTTPTVYKKKLISKAPYLLSIKGTTAALANFVETYTGYNTTVNDSTSINTRTGLANLLLTPQDSSFHNGQIGGWANIAYSTLSVEASSDIPTSEQYSFKPQYRLKVITNSPTTTVATFRLGSPPPDSLATIRVKEALGYGIPITPGTAYSFSFYSKYSGSTFTLKPYVTWCDAYGNVLSTSTSSGVTVTSAWTKFTYTPTAPGKAKTATGYTVGPTATKTVISMPTGHGFSSGDKVWFEDDLLPFSGGYTLTDASTNSITIPYYEPGITYTSVSSSSTTFTLGTGSTSTVAIGQLITISSGTGTLNSVTKVVEILSDTTFKVDSTPTVALSGATIVINTYSITRDFIVYKGTGSTIVKETPAEYAMLGFNQNITGGTTYTYYLHSIQFAPSSVTSFTEPRCIDIWLEPSKTNYLIDPTFAGSGWSYAGGASSPAGYTNEETSTLTGLPYAYTSKMGKIITGSSNSTASAPDLKTASPTPIINNNTYYTFSVYIKGNDSYSLTLGLKDGVNSAEKVINVTTSWQRVFVNLYVTSTSTGLTPYIYSNSSALVDGGNGTRSSAQTFRVDDAQLEEAQIPSDYFDGNFTIQGAFWSGTANASKSYLYVNKEQKISELAAHINDWVPFNSLWMLRSRYGIEVIGAPSSTTIPSTAPYNNTGDSGGRGFRVAL